MKRFIGVLILTLLTLISPVAPAAHAGSYIQAIRTMPVRGETALVKLLSDTPMSLKQAENLMDGAERAYDFDLAQFHWEKEGVFTDQFIIAVLSRSFMKQCELSFDGNTMSRDLILINEVLISADKDKRCHAVMAHEITHLLVRRRACGIDLRNLGWYAYMGEGLAMENGAAFRFRSFPRAYPDMRDRASRKEEVLTADDVRWVFAHEDGKSIVSADDKKRWDLRYSVGYLFIEYLHARGIKNERAEPLVQSFGTILCRMIQSKMTFSQAFQSEFDLSLEDAKEHFTHFIEDTEGDPEKRFTGTALKPREHKKKSKAPRDAEEGRATHTAHRLSDYSVDCDSSPAISDSSCSRGGRKTLSAFSRSGKSFSTTCHTSAISTFT
jgi:hypothetical protein